MSVDITEPTSLERAHAAAGPLGRAALAALRAPAVLDTQPWRWRLRGHVGELWADPTAAADPGPEHPGPEHPGHSAPRDDRLVMLCCGIALHHVTTALPALGRRAAVTRLPDPARPDLTAVLRLTGRHRPAPDEIRAYQAMLGRRLIPAITPLSTIPTIVPLTTTIPDPAALIRPARTDTGSNGNGGSNGSAEPAGEGGPGTTVGRPIQGEVLVALRQAAEDNGAHLHVPRAGSVGAHPTEPVGGPAGTLASGTDDALLCALTDDPAGWLAAGEALSAVLILAAQRGVTVRPLTHPAGTLPLPVEQGHPMLALRLAAVQRR
jgi:hypothetical protein